jgi:osmotically-inducible protein OsmY
MKQRIARHLLTLGLTLSAGIGILSLSGCVPIIAGGAGVGVLMHEDRRTAGTYLLDQEIELKAAARIRENAGKDSQVNVTSYNRRVMLTGQVPNNEARTRFEELSKAVPNVREVMNELVIGEVRSFGTGANDTYITTKVKTRLLEDTRFNAHHVKVVTEAGTVFLMGIVKREEGNAAGEIAARTGGVEKVVKVFEYMD